MDALRREQILRVYVGHRRRFDEIAAQPFHTTGIFSEGDPAGHGPQLEPAADQGTAGWFPLDRLDILSRRERDVLALVARGCSNQEIATQLEITAETVKTHIRHILRRAGARNRAHAVALAFRGGLDPRSATAAPSGGDEASG